MIASDWESLFGHTRTNKTMAGRIPPKPFFRLREMLNSATIQNIALVAGSDNPADALTIGTLLSTGTSPRINPFTWLKNKSGGINTMAGD